MGFRINTNVSSINAQRNLLRTSLAFSRSLERLSSGLRITRAADDAAGLALSERFRAQIASLSQARRNANDGVSLLQVAEGSLAETSANLIRLRELAVQAANGTLGSSERATLNSELQALTSEISRIAEITEFNGTNVLNDSSATLTFQVGPDAGAANEITVSGVNATASALSIDSLDISTASGATSALAAIDDAVDQVASLRAGFGASQNRLESAIRSIGVAIENSAAAESRIRDVDVAAESSLLARAQLLQQAGVASLVQANLNSSVVLRLLGQS